MTAGPDIRQHAIEAAARASYAVHHAAQGFSSAWEDAPVGVRQVYLDDAAVQHDAMAPIVGAELRTAVDRANLLHDALADAANNIGDSDALNRANAVLRADTAGHLSPRHTDARRVPQFCDDAQAETERLRTLVGEEGQPGWDGCSRAEAIRQANEFHAGQLKWMNLFEQMKAEREEARAQVAELTRARDEAVARADNAERERDQARRGLTRIAEEIPRLDGLDEERVAKALEWMHQTASAALEGAAEPTAQIGPGVPKPFDWYLADKARYAVTLAKRDPNPGTVSVLLRALKIMRDAVLEDGGDGSIGRLMPYAKWAAGGASSEPASGGAGEATEEDGR